MPTVNNLHSNNSAKRPRRTAVWVGGAVGFMLILLAVTYLTITPNPLRGEAISSAASHLQPQKQSQPLVPLDGCATKEAKQPDCEVSATINALDSFWSTYLPQQGFRYAKPKVIFFEKEVNTDCDTVSSASGTFYCHLNETLYYDADFFKELQKHSDNERYIEALNYAVSQNFGRHIQNLTGDFEHFSKESGIEKEEKTGRKTGHPGSKYLGLQADCFVGLWERFKQKQHSPVSTPTEEMKKVTAAGAKKTLNVLETLSIERQKNVKQGNAEEKPQSSPEQRAYWYMLGYEKDDFSQCNTIAK